MNALVKYWFIHFILLALIGEQAVKISNSMTRIGSIIPVPRLIVLQCLMGKKKVMFLTGDGCSTSAISKIFFTQNRTLFKTSEYDMEITY